MSNATAARCVASAGLLLALFARNARADTPAGARMLDLKSGTLTYTLVHKLHEVRGTTSMLEGRALVLADGSARVQVRAPVASFESGNANRDAHMREVTHELQHRYVSVKATLSGLALPLVREDQKTITAVVELNGERHELPVKVTLTPDGPRVKAHLSFPLSLTAFKIDRPELLLIKSNDDVKLDGDLVFEEAK